MDTLENRDMSAPWQIDSYSARFRKKAVAIRERRAQPGRLDANDRIGCGIEAGRATNTSSAML